MNLAYYIFLLLIIFLLISLMKKNLEASPKKIKVYMVVVISLFILRYIGLFLLCIMKDGRFVYMLKPLLFLNHLAIPLIILALAYVYLRWDRLSFTINYIIAFALTVLYGIAIFTMKGKVIFNPTYGYLINIYNETALFLGSLVVLGGLLLYCIYYLDKPNNNKKGMIYLIIASAVVILENVLYLGGLRLFPYPIFGDGIFLVIIGFAINTFKKTSNN